MNVRLSFCLSVVIAALAATVAVPALAHASTLLDDVSPEELTDQSQAIFVGRCQKTEAKWSRDRKLISTYATYEVEEPVIGPDSRQQVVVKSLGGTVGTISQVLVGGPVFAPGDHDVLFLTPSDEPAVFKLAGPLDQGRLKVRQDHRTGELKVQDKRAAKRQRVEQQDADSPAQARERQRRNEPQAQEASAASGDEELPLGGMLQKIRRRAESGGQGRRR